MLYTPTIGKISSPFGWRWRNTDWHGGIDFGAPVGTPVFAANGGTVLGVWPNGALNKYGRVIVLKHNEPYDAPYSLYAHLSDTIVAPGQPVIKGQRIGYTGTTAASREDSGRKVPPHLHFELLSHWPPPKPDVYRVDPTSFLDPKLVPPNTATGIGIGTLLLLGGAGYYFWRKRR
jgi:LPXTG-motif cell wall-anchored protein